MKAFFRLDKGENTLRSREKVRREGADVFSPLLGVYRGEMPVPGEKTDKVEEDLVMEIG